MNHISAEKEIILNKSNNLDTFSYLQYVVFFSRLGIPSSYFNPTPRSDFVIDRNTLWWINPLTFDRFNLIELLVLT